MTRKTKAKFNKLMRLHEKRYKLFLKYEPLETRLGKVSWPGNLKVSWESKEHNDLIDKIVPLEGMMQEISNEIESICDDLINMAE